MTTPETITVLIVDDHEVVRMGLEALLGVTPGFIVVGQAGTCAEAITAVERLRPRVVLMDQRLPGRSGIEACREITGRWPNTRVIMLTSFIDDSLVVDAVRAGASGYVLKKVVSAELLSAIRAVAQGDASFDPAAAAALVGRFRRDERALDAVAFHELSPRELEVLTLLAQGRTNAEIAAAVGLAEKTVANHVSTIFVKLGVTNRVEAAAYAIHHHVGRATSGDTGS
jgi:two-component system, NarL family, response regulator DevR